MAIKGACVRGISWLEEWLRQRGDQKQTVVWGEREHIVRGIDSRVFINTTETIFPAVALSVWPHLRVILPLVRFWSQKCDEPSGQRSSSAVDTVWAELFYFKSLISVRPTHIARIIKGYIYFSSNIAQRLSKTYRQIFLFLNNRGRGLLCYSNRPPEGNWDAVASPLRCSRVQHPPWLKEANFDIIGTLVCRQQASIHL